MLVVHAGPRLLKSSFSLDVRQLSSRSCASVVGSGAITRDARLPDDPPRSTSLWDASTMSDRGAKRKCTSSGAFGSRMFAFSRAYNQQTNTTSTSTPHRHDSRCRCENVEHATTGNHIIAVTADFQACIEDGTVSQIVQQCTLAATAALTLA